MTVSIVICKLRCFTFFLLICASQWSFAVPFGHLPELGNVAERVRTIRKNIQDATETSSPCHFFGSSTSDHQVAGNNDNNTHYLFERAKNPHYPHIREIAGLACNQPNYLDGDIAAMKSMGLAWHRF